MVTVPPPNLPDILAATLKTTPTVPIVVDAVTLTTSLAATRLQTVIQILSAQPDLERSLINLTTPQGPVTVQLPANAQIPLPNGQTLPLQTVLQNLTPFEQRTGLFLQVDPNPQPGGQPLLRLHIAPEILTPRLGNQPQQPATNLAAAPTTLSTAATQNSTGAIRTTAFPVPADIVGTLPARVAAPVTAAPEVFIPATPAAPVAGAQAAAPAARPVEIVSVPLPGTQPATILGSTPRGDTVVQLPNGETLSLAHVRGGSPGETLHIKVLPPAGSAYGVPAAAEGLMKEGTPPGMRAALDVLQAVDPAMAARVSTQLVMPLQTASPSHVGSTLLFFLTAMGGAMSPQASAAFVPALHAALEKTLPRLARDKLIEELQGLARTTPDMMVDGDEWRGIQLPTPNLSTLHGPVWLYVHHRHDGHGGGSSTPDSAPGIKQTRFVVDLKLSRLGHTQLEGLAQHGSGTARIDLKLNTPADMPQYMQQELTALYANSASAYGFAGELLFTTGAPIELNPRAAVAASI